MTRRLRWAHALHGPGLPAALLTFLVVLQSIRQELVENLVLWGHVNHGLVYSLSLLVPLTAAAAAWSAGQDQDSGWRAFAVTGARSPMAGHLVAIAGVAAPVLTAYLGAVAVAVSWTAGRTSWGQPDPGVIVVACAGIVAACAAGYACGWPGARWMVAPLAAAGAYFLQYLLVEPPRPASSLVAIPPGLYDPFRVRLGWTTWALAGWQLLVAATATAAIGLFVAPRRSRRWMTLLCVSALTVGALLGLLRLPPLWLVDRPVLPDPVCARGSPPVCVHPAYSALLPEIARTIHDAVGPLSGLSGVPTRAEQRSGFPPTRVAPDGLLAFHVPEAGRRYDVAAMRIVVSEALVTGDCTERLFEQEADRAAVDPRLEAQRAVLSWLLAAQGPGSPGEAPPGSTLYHSDSEYLHAGSDWRAAAQRFAASPDAARRSWLDAGLVRLRSCEVSVGELPG